MRTVWIQGGILASGGFGAGEPVRRAVRFDAADRLGCDPPDGAGVIAAEVDGHGVLGDVHGDDLPGVDAAEGDLLSDDHDDAGIAGPARRSSRSFHACSYLEFQGSSEAVV
jgi:hypothetical protein